jgi:flagellar basal body-associated protein FliL
MKSAAVLILLAIMLFILIVGIKIYKKTMSEKTAMEKDAINKGLLAYFITDSPILGWLVYRKNDPKNRLKQ